MKRIKYSILAAAAALPVASLLLASAAGPNLLPNGTFDSDVNGWVSFGGNPQWVDGKLQITNTYTGTGNSYSSGLYCITGISEGTSYTYSSDAFIGEDQPMPDTRVVLYAYFLAGDNCEGSPMGSGEASGGHTLAQRGVWIPLSTTMVAPAGAKSAYLRPTAVKEPTPYGTSISETLTVYFHNMYFGETNWQDPNQQPDPQPEQPQDEPVEDEQVPDPLEVPDEPEAPPIPEDTEIPEAPETPEPPQEDPELPATPESPSTPGAQSDQDEPSVPSFPWEPPAVETPGDPAPEAPAPAPAPEVPEVEEQAPPVSEPVPAPFAPTAPSGSDPLPPATGESLARKVTSPFGALAMSFGLALASFGAAAMGAARRK